MANKKENDLKPVFDESTMVKFEGVEIAAVHPRITATQLKQIADSYDKELIEAPVIITHEAGRPKSWASFGWVQKVWFDGKKLFADMLLIPEMVEILKKGLVKTRSIYTYFENEVRSMYLGHVAFLGSELPAIAGMPDLKYSAKTNGEEIFFQAGQDWKHIVTADVFQRIRDFLIEQYGLETADDIISQWNIDELKIKPDPAPELNEVGIFKKENELSGEKIYTQENLDTFVKGEMSKAELKFKSDHAVEIQDIQAKLDTAKAEIVTLKKDKETLERDKLALSKEVTEAKIETDVNTLIGEGRIQPKQKDEISLSLTNALSLSKEAYDAQLGIYKALSQVSFGADGSVDGPGPEPTGKKKFSVVDGVVEGGAS
jgi:hypothetical protein